MSQEKAVVLEDEYRRLNKMSPSWEAILGTVSGDKRAILEYLKSELEEMSPSMCRETIIKCIDGLPNGAAEATHWKDVRKMARDYNVSIDDLRKAHVIAFKQPLLAQH